MGKGEDKETFMNLMTDYGFKRMFGSNKRKQILIKFLNIIFEKDGIVVKDVTFHDKEILPPDKDGKRIVYDVYCTTPNDKEHIIVEMQQVYHDYFENRTLLYASKMIAEQKKKGGDYDLSPVYSIFLVDFHFPHMTRNDIHDVKLMDVNTHEVYSEALRMLFLHLAQAKKNWESCTTAYDKLLFVIKNMHKMDKESKAYLSGEFDEMFREAEVSSLASEDFVLYSQSRLKYEENLAAVRYAEKSYFQKGELSGLKKGRAEGRAEGIESVARKMMEKGMSAELIESLTGLSPQQLN